MPGTLQPLDQKFAIVDNQGRPTEYFIRWAQQKQIDITDSITLIDLQDYLTAHKLIPGTGIQFTPDGDINNDVTIHADVQAILDEVTATRGAILYRGLLGWAALLPGTAGQFLQTAGAGTDPLWAAAGGGGAFSINGLAVTNIPTTATFSLVQGVAGSATVVNTSRGVRLSVTGAGAADRNALLEVASPSATWTLDALILPNVLQRNFLTFGVYVKDSASGKIHAFTNAWNAAVVFRQLRWTNLTTFSTSSDLSTIYDLASPLYFRLVLDAVNLTAFLSTDGEAYIQIYQIAKFNFVPAITHCGIFFGVNQQTAPQNMAEYLNVFSFHVA
jgi:hypothetical protein